MILRDTLLGVLKDQRTPSAPKPEVERALAKELPPPAQQVIVLTGVRRAGKSVLQTQLLRSAGDAPLYINLEDTRLFSLGPDDFPTLIELVAELAAGKAVFLDEVQEVEAWERLVRALLDRGHAVCVTGSNASLLSRDLGSKLTGRHRSFEVFPFSYSEYLRFSGRSRNVDTLTSYLDHGGFPSYLHTQDPAVLQQLLRDIVERDIAQRHHVRESRHLMNIALFLLAHTGQPISLQSLTKNLRVPTVSQTSRYVEFLQDAYLLFAVQKFSPSFQQRVVAPAKYYAIDTGLRRVNSPNFTPDVGRRLENAVFLHLRRLSRDIWYAGEKDRWECDFITKDLAVQVCASLTEANRARELEGVRQATKLPGKRRPIVVTVDQRDRISEGGLVVDVVPAWEWLD